MSVTVCGVQGPVRESRRERESQIYMHDKTEAHHKWRNYSLLRGADY